MLRIKSFLILYNFYFKYLCPSFCQKRIDIIFVKKYSGFPLLIEIKKKRHAFYHTLTYDKKLGNQNNVLCEST